MSNLIEICSKQVPIYTFFLQIEDSIKCCVMLYHHLSVIQAHDFVTSRGYPNFYYGDKSYLYADRVRIDRHCLLYSTLHIILMLGKLGEIHAYVD